MADGLEVRRWAEGYDRNVVTQERTYVPDSYRVTITCVDIAFSECFARESDATAAMKAIEPVLDWIGTDDEIEQRILEFGRDKLNKLMMEALQW